MHEKKQVVRHCRLFRLFEKFVFGHALHAVDCLLHGAHVAHGLHNVARAGFALGANHGCAFLDTAQRFAKVARTAYERHLELRLVNVERIIGWGKHFGFVDVVDVYCLEHLRFDEMANAALRHNGNAHGFLNALDHFGVAHAGNAARCANIGRNAFECHNGAGSGGFGNARLFGRGDVHDNAALKHLCQFPIEPSLCSPR